MPRFPLQAILSLREQIESQKKNELAAVIEGQRLLEEQKRKIVEERMRLHKTYENMIDLQAIKEINTYDKYLKKNIKSLDRQIEIKIECVHEKQQELATAMKEKKVLDKLKEKQEQYNYCEERRLSQLDADELANNRYYSAQHEERAGENG